jgi:hypothetical protein
MALEKAPIVRLTNEGVFELFAGNVLHFLALHLAWAGEMEMELENLKNFADASGFPPYPSKDEIELGLTGVPDPQAVFEATISAG